jgi:CRISPR/Cas system-associated exonuclease Cas4 (RecB family)
VTVPHVGWEVDGVRYSLEEALEIAQREKTFYGFPPSVLKALTQETRTEIRLSPSSASGCKRRRILEMLEPYYLDPEKLWAAAIGRAVHEWLQNIPEEGVIRELELTMPLDVYGVTVPLVGRIDYYDPERKLLLDYKTVSEFTNWNSKTGKRELLELPAPDHVLQVNLYSLLLRYNGYSVEEAAIWYVRVHKTATRRIYPVELWDEEEAYLWAVELAAPLAEAVKTGKLPPPYPEEHPDAWRCKFCPVSEACRIRAERGE